MNNTMVCGFNLLFNKLSFFYIQGLYSNYCFLLDVGIIVVSNFYMSVCDPWIQEDGILLKILLCHLCRGLWTLRVLNNHYTGRERSQFLICISVPARSGTKTAKKPIHDHERIKVAIDGSKFGQFSRDLMNFDPCVATVVGQKLLFWFTVQHAAEGISPPWMCGWGSQFSFSHLTKKN